MNAKQYLESIKRDRERIKYLKSRCETLELDYGLKAVDYSQTRVQSSFDNPLERRAWELLERTEKIKGEIISLTLEVDRKLSEIGALENGLYMQMLFMQYSENKSLKEVAEIMGYDYKYICKLNGDALRAFGAMHEKTA